MMLLNSVLSGAFFQSILRLNKNHNYQLLYMYFNHKFVFKLNQNVKKLEFCRFFCHLIHDLFLVKMCALTYAFFPLKNRWLKLNSQHGSTTRRFYWGKSGFMVFLMILWRNNYLIMWRGDWVCYMLWSTRETELWLQHKVNFNPKSSILKNIKFFHFLYGVPLAVEFWSVHSFF